MPGRAAVWLAARCCGCCSWLPLRRRARALGRWLGGLLLALAAAAPAHHADATCALCFPELPEAERAAPGARSTSAALGRSAGRARRAVVRRRASGSSAWSAVEGASI
ncbi:MAG: hypothetical protein MZW92_39690 [Comamonadaceae bacterium]|nr:hypothetical protein [Comamonadaceae bacterium]